MVLSTTKRTASVDSIINQNQGGGNKKAGLQPVTNKGYMFAIAMRVHPTRNTQANYGSPTVIMGLKHTRVPHKALKNVGSTYTPNTYFAMHL